MATNDKKKGIDTNSNVYTIIYAAVMVIIVAFLLAFCALALKPQQEANEKNDVKGQILTALCYDKDSVDVATIYEKVVKDSLWDGEKMIAYKGDFLTKYGSAIQNGNLHVFTATAKNGEKAYVIPMVGRGLWGGLWGYLAINEAKDKIIGAYFYHESETAGLGARIGEPEFQKEFRGMSLYGIDGTSIAVVKNGAAKDPKASQVDGITGATLTSNGVSNMLRDGLKAYESFLKVQDDNSDDVDSKCCGKCSEDQKCEGNCAKCRNEDKCSECPNESKCEGRAACEKAEGCPTRTKCNKK